MRRTQVALRYRLVISGLASCWLLYMVLVSTIGMRTTGKDSKVNPTAGMMTTSAHSMNLQVNQECNISLPTVSRLKSILAQHNSYVALCKPHPKLIVQPFEVAVFVCFHERSSTYVVSATSAQPSDIYVSATTDYRIMFKTAMLNMHSLGLTCKAYSTSLMLARSRHLKVVLLSKFCAVFQRVYWTDVDVLHGSMEFLNSMTQTGIHAAQEELKYVDNRYIDLYSTNVKLMSGNMLVVSGDYTAPFFHSWLYGTLTKSTTIDDQWSFEELQHDERFAQLFTPASFMSYDKRADVLHLVGENKIDKLRTWKGRYMSSLHVHVKTILANIDSFLGVFKIDSSYDSFTFNKTCHSFSSSTKCFDDKQLECLLLQFTGIDLFMQYVQKTDFLRYVISYLTGNLYLDSDATIVDLDPGLIQDKNTGILSMEEDANSKIYEVLCQWAFKFKFKSPCARTLLHDILYDALFYPKLKLPTSWLTGPMRFTHFRECFEEEGYIIKKQGSFKNGIVQHIGKGSWLSEESWDKIELM